MNNGLKSLLNFNMVSLQYISNINWIFNVMSESELFQTLVLTDVSTYIEHSKDEKERKREKTLTIHVPAVMKPCKTFFDRA